MFSTGDGSVRLVIAVTKFGLKQNLCEHIDQIREGVGTPLFGLVRYVSFAEHSIPVFNFTTYSLTEGVFLDWKS